MSVGRSSATIVEAPTAGMETNTSLGATFNQLAFDFVLELVVGDLETLLHIIVCSHVFVVSPFLLRRFVFVALGFDRLNFSVRNFELADPRRKDGTVEFVKGDFF